MNPRIIELVPFVVAGKTLRQKTPKMNWSFDKATFWSKLYSDAKDKCKELERFFPKSKRGEIRMCYDIDIDTEEFTYLLGRSIDNTDILCDISSDVVSVNISGLYAVFTTELTERGNQYEQSIHDMWNSILIGWFPNSNYMYDETRKDFEYCDDTKQSMLFNEIRQVNIYIPVYSRNGNPETHISYEV